MPLWPAIKLTDTVITPDAFDFTTKPTARLGDPITFTYTVNNTSSAYEGTHALYQDVVIPSLDTGPALAIEEITIAHEGIWL